MAFSYLSVIYSDLDENIYSEGKNLVNEKAVVITRSYNNGCRAMIHSNGDYPVTIGFTRIGSPSYYCTCVVFSYDCICEHIIATTIAYDRSRGVSFTP